MTDDYQKVIEAWRLSSDASARLTQASDRLNSLRSAIIRAEADMAEAVRCARVTWGEEDAVRAAWIESEKVAAERTKSSREARIVEACGVAGVQS